MVQESSLQGHRTLIGLGKHEKETDYSVWMTVNL